MRPDFTAIEEIEAHRHPLLADAHRFQILRIQHDANLESGDSTLVLRLRHRETHTERVLSFTGVICDHPLMHCIGLYMMDMRYRGWDNLRIEVGECFEDGGVIFRAKDVRDITDSE